MMINGIISSGGQIGVSPASDPITKSIQSQINDLQKQLQELSTDETISAEEKLQKQQELQAQIADLNNQLRQHQMDQRKEKIEKITTDSTSEQVKMKTMISAEASLEQAKIQGALADNMEKRAVVLKSEMSLEAARGNSSIESKQKGLARVTQAAMDARASQMQALGEANQALEKAKKAEENTDKADREEEQDKKAEDETSAARKKYQSLFYTSDGNMAEEKSESRISVRA